MRLQPQQYCWYNDPVFYLILLTGFFAWLLPEPKIQLSIWLILKKSFLEELLFRALLLNILSEYIRHQYHYLTLANIFTSTIFAVMHLFYHPLMWALATFFPSLIFGFLWERYHNILPCWLCHAIYY